jgi:hypothetical protein
MRRQRGKTSVEQVEGIMNKREAFAERARLQQLLTAYEAGRLNHRAEDERLNREVTPDRADKVRARIARLDQIVAENDQA